MIELCGGNLIISNGLNFVFVSNEMLRDSHKVNERELWDEFEYRKEVKSHAFDWPELHDVCFKIFVWRMNFIEISSEFLLDSYVA